MFLVIADGIYNLSKVTRIRECSEKDKEKGYQTVIWYEQLTFEGTKGTHYTGNPDSSRIRTPYKKIIEILINHPTPTEFGRIIEFSEEDERFSHIGE